jgi:hypothetical protein
MSKTALMFAGQGAQGGTAKPPGLDERDLSRWWRQFKETPAAHPW